MSSTAAVSADRIVLVDPSNPDAAREYGGLHAVSPILFGLAVPFVLLLVLAPQVFVDLGVSALAILMLIMLAAAVIFVHGLFTRGRIAAVAFDGASRTVDIIESGTFHRTVERMPFADVAGLRANPHYDRDGYRYLLTELVLRSGEVVILPIAPTNEELRFVRTLLGR